MAHIPMKKLSKQRAAKTRRQAPPPGGLEPPTFRLTAERANQLRHGGSGVPIDYILLKMFLFEECFML